MVSRLEREEGRENRLRENPHPFENCSKTEGKILRVISLVTNQEYF